MELQKLFVTLALDMKDYASGMDDAANRARSFGDRVRLGLGVTLATAGAGLAAVGGGIVALGATSVGVATEFQSSMAIMSTAVDPVSVGAASTAEAMDILGDAALAVGSDTALVGVSASSSAEAMTGLYKAGLSTGEIFGDLQGYLAGTAELGGALRASIDLAAASELDMVAASELAAVTLATFGGELTTAEERSEFVNASMNNFIQTADASVASVQDLADAFVNVGPVAAGMGMGVEQVNTALGIMSMRGITGAEAGTQLKSMILSLTDANGPASKTLAELGISLYDLEGSMRTLPDIIYDIEGATIGMTEEQKNATLANLAGSYGINAMNSLLTEGSAGWWEMTDAIGGAATMQETAAARTQTLAGAQEALSGVWETFQIKVGTALIPVLTSLAAIGSTLLEKYGPTLTAVFENVGSAISIVIDALSGGLLTKLFAMFGQFDDAFSQMGAVMDFAAALRDLFIAFGMGDEQAKNLSLSITGIIQAVHGALSPIVSAVTNFVSFKDVLIALGILILATVIPAVVSLVVAMAPILLVVGALIAAVALLRNAWENNWGGIQGKVGAVVAWLQTTIQTVVGAVIAWWNATWPTIQATIEAVWGIVQTVIQTAIDIIRPAIETLVENGKTALDGLGNLVAPLQGLWQKIGPFVQAAATLIGGILTTLLGLIVGIVKGISEAIGPLIDTFINLAQNVIQIVGGIIETFTGFFNLIIGLVTGNSELIQKAWEQMTAGIKSIVTGLVTGVVELISGLWTTLKALVGGIVEGIVEFFTDLWDKLVGHSIVVDIVEDVVRWFDDMLDMLVEVLRNLWDRVSRPFFEMWANLTAWFAEKIEAMKAIGRSIIDGLIAGIEAGKELLRGILQGVANLIPDWLKSFLGIASPAQATVPLGISLMQGIEVGIINATPATENAADDAAAAIVQGFVEGLQEWSTDATEAFEEYISNPIGGMMSGLAAMLEFGDKAGSIAGGIAGHFERQVLDPMKDRLDSLQGVLDDRMPGIAERWQGLTGFGMMDWNDRSQFDAVLTSLYRLQRGIMPGSALAADVQASIDAMIERNGLEAEYIRQQERLMALEQARADMDFLKQQMELLGLMRDNNIPLAALGGLQLGLTADPGALMDVMVGVMETIVRDTQYELNDAFNQSPAVNSPTPGTERSSTMNVQTQNINGGQHIYLYDTEESELERLGVLSR